MSSLLAIAEHKYVSITTIKRSGDTVSSPVWISPLGDGTAGFTTGATTGKVKRIRNNPAVTLRPCDARGKVADGAVEVTAMASVLLGADAAPIEHAIKAKYGLMFTLMTVGSKIKSTVTRKNDEPCAVHLRFD